MRRTLGPAIVSSVMVLVAGAFAAACGEKGPPPKGDELAAALADPEVVILDVRSPGEYAEGHVPGAVNLPVADIGRATEVAADKSAPIVVHCAVGVRSARAKKALIEQGYTRVIDAQTPGTIAEKLGVELVK